MLFFFFFFSFLCFFLSFFSFFILRLCSCSCASLCGVRLALVCRLACALVGGGAKSSGSSFIIGAGACTFTSGRLAAHAGGAIFLGSKGAAWTIVPQLLRVSFSTIPTDSEKPRPCRVARVTARYSSRTRRVTAQRHTLLNAIHVRETNHRRTRKDVRQLGLPGRSSLPRRCWWCPHAG